MVDAAGSMGKKADRRLRAAAPLLARVTADLRDVDLARLPGMVRGGSGGSSSSSSGSGGSSNNSDPPPPPLLAVGKHLCGVATDYALRAFARAAAARTGAGEAAQSSCPSTNRPRSAVAVATCCHHRGHWRDFCGRAAWRAAGLSRADFEAALWLSGWANSPAHAARQPAPEGTPRAWNRRLAAEAAAAEAAAPGATSGRRNPRCPDAALGRRCRELIDCARCAWLEARLQPPHAKVEHLAFVGPSVTPENRMILGIT